MAVAPSEIDVAGHRLAVRPLRVDEAPRVVAYFLDASDADMERMGIVERARLPTREAWLGLLEETVRTPPERASSFYLAWLVDGQAVGHCSVKDIRQGDEAALHLHMWSASHHGHGHGQVLFALSALDSYERFRLRSLVCEPQVSNPMPNRMLAKSGYPLVGSRVGASSELSRITTLNRYRIDRAVAEAVVSRIRQ